MPLLNPSERYVRSASMIMLSVAVFASASATLIPWLSPVRHPLDLIVPPAMCAVFIGLLIALMRQPQWTYGIIRIALLASVLALAAPAWLYTVQATLTPGLQLISIYPPVSSLMLMLMVMVMIFLPARQAFLVAALAWLLIALPVLVYLFAHPQEMDTPRGGDLLMTYGPVIILVIVLLPVRQGLASKMQQLASEKARMEIMVNRDPLTRIHNRRLGEQVLQDILNRQIPAGVIMFDMDRFKAINDTHGHPVGDRVLQGVAQRCKELLRKDECLSRWGGEEFMVVVPDVDAAALQQLAERLRLAIADLPIERVPQVTASVGVALIQDDDSLASLLQRVDEALYRAKQQGGNCVRW
ncbi:MAG TPA: GGDEF domain-containing protein [Rhodanobacter sp.]